MNFLEEFYKLWYIKMGFGLILTIIAPVQTSVIIIFIMIILDTITGVACAIKAKRFNSRALRRNIKKVIIYGGSIITVRLVEIGVLQNMDTILFTQIMAGFLIVTEAISVLENLTILGLPLPIDFFNILFKYIRIGGFEDAIVKSQKEKSELKDIEDIIYFQLPTINSNYMKKLLEIKFEIWLQISKDIISYFNNLENPDNDLIYYKILSFVDIGNKEIYKNWDEEEIPILCIDMYKKSYLKRMEEWSISSKEICYKDIPFIKKKEELIKKITILLYQTIIDAQKNEKEIINVCGN